jgi:hypothetical protein
MPHEFGPGDLSFSSSDSQHFVTLGLQQIGDSMLHCAAWQGNCGSLIGSSSALKKRIVNDDLAAFEGEKTGSVP